MLSQEARSHFNKYWHLSVRFFEEGDYALASFFAITLIEEVGKIIILGNKQLGGVLDEKGFRDHKRKYRYAVYSTLLINSRYQRVYGKQAKRFAEWFEDNQLFTIRNNSLYLELKGNLVITPPEVIVPADAFLLVCTGGEVLAEIQGIFAGTGPDEWLRLLNEVNDFLARHDSFLS